MKNSVDQLEQELSDWNDREQRYVKLFGKSTIEGRTFQKEKLAMFERLEIRYGDNGLDRIGSLALRQRRREMERKVYPNLAARMLYRLVKAILPNGKTFAYEKAIQGNLKKLHKQSSSLGFNITESRLEHMIRQGNREAVVPVSYYVNQSERMDFELKFRKDANGTYELDHYRAKYEDLTGGIETRTCSFNQELSADVTTRQAYNLLAGRAACVGSDSDKHWIQLDFNDKDAKGNYVTKVFPMEYGFDLSASLKQSGINEPDYFSNMKLVSSLGQGDRLTVAQGSKAVEIEANPQRKRLDVYDHGVLMEKTDKGNSKKTKVLPLNVKMEVTKPARAKGLGK